MSETKRIRLTAYPKETPLVCLAHDESSIINLAASLEKSVDRYISQKSSLVFAGELCLGLSLRTREIPGLLPRICEHSEAVCIGKSYPELFCEHGEVLIAENALKILSSQRGNSSRHVL